MSKNKKKRKDIVYSTNPDFEYSYEEEQEVETLDSSVQKLRVAIDKKQRKGKVVTLVSGFIGTENDLQALCKMLKVRCGVGGSVKGTDILIQGDKKNKIHEILLKNGYKNTKLA